VLHGTLPVWARAGFSDPKVRIAHSFSAARKLVAILWANPLLSPPPKDHNNKILWVARVPDSKGASLYIRAQRMNGSTKVGTPTSRVLVGGRDLRSSTCPPRDAGASPCTGPASPTASISATRRIVETHASAGEPPGTCESRVRRSGLAAGSNLCYSPRMQADWTIVSSPARPWRRTGAAL
jgi:hypothetical protein